MRRKKCFTVQITLCLLVILSGHVPAFGRQMQKRGVMDNFNDGLKIAGQMFGINTAADVANLVAKAFSTTQNRNKPDLMSLFEQRQHEANSANSAEQPTDTRQSQEQQQQQYASEEQQPQATQAQASSEPRPTPALPAKEHISVDFGAAKLVTSMLRMIGFDASKLGALAVNALIMIAQAIGNTLMGATNRRHVVSSVDGGRLFASHSNDDHDDEPEALRGQDAHQPRSLRDGTPIDWFLERPNKQMRQLLDEVMSAQLADKLTDMIAKLEVEEGQGACLKMLLCKSAPFIWGMQKSLSKRLAGKTSAAVKVEEEATVPPEQKQPEPQKPLSAEGFFTHMPSITEYREHGAQCEQRYAMHCNTTRPFKPHERGQRG